MPIAKKVRDIMVPISDYALVKEDQPLRDAVLTLQKVYCEVEDGACTEAGHRTVLVMNERGDLVGILSFSAILAILIPEISGGLSAKVEALGVTIAFAQADALDLDEARAGFRARVLRNAETPVKHAMLKLRGTISADADLLEGLKLMYQNKLVVLPVFEGDKLVGVLRDSDLFLAVASILSE
jgi:CBS domain-containing protein